MSDTSSTVSYHGMSLTVLKDSVFFVATLLTKFNVRVDIDSHMENTYITTSFYQDGWLGSLEPRNFLLRYLFQARKMSAHYISKKGYGCK